jgi:hypothetical protein
MRAYSLNELFRLTRNELFELHAEIVRELDDMPEDSAELATAFENLRLIRRALAHPRCMATLG